MKVSEHIAYGGVASISLAPFFGVKTIFFFLGSILIDLDHYIDFLYYNHFKNWSFKKMFQFHGVLSRWVHQYPILALEAFHTVEFLTGWLLLAIYFHSIELSLALAGMVFHLCLDLIRLKNKKIIHVRALSFFEYRVRTKKVLAQGGPHPEKIFWQAYAAIAGKTYEI